jgi:hypothetical protein
VKSINEILKEKKDKHDKMFEMYCRDTDAGDFHSYFSNYAAGFDMAIKAIREMPVIAWMNERGAIIPDEEKSDKFAYTYPYEIPLIRKPDDNT